MSDNGLSTPSAVIIMISSMLGSGVIFLPKAFRALGYIMGPLTLFAISLLSFATLYAISFTSFHVWENKNKKKKEQPHSDDLKEQGVSYYSVSKHYSSIIALLVDSCLVLQGLGSCLCYILKIMQIYSALLGKEIKWWQSIICIIPMYCLAMLKNLSSLKFAGYLSVFSVGYLMMVLSSLSVYLLFFLDGENLYKLRLIQDNMNKGESKVSDAFGTIIFALGCHQNIVQVFSDLKHKSIKNITFVSFFSILGGSLIYLVIGLAGFYIGGNEIDNSILDVLIGGGSDNQTLGTSQFIKDNTHKFVTYLINTGVVLFTVVMFCAFPLQMHPARDSLINIIKSCKARFSSVEIPGDFLKYIITTIYCTFICALAMKNLNPTIIVSFIGATATNGITYIFPSILFVMCLRKKCLKSAMGCFVAGFGVFSMLYMIYGIVKNLNETSK